MCKFLKIAKRAKSLHPVAQHPAPADRSLLLSVLSSAARTCAAIRFPTELRLLDGRASVASQFYHCVAAAVPAASGRPRQRTDGQKRHCRGGWRTQGFADAVYTHGLSWGWGGGVTSFCTFIIFYSTFSYLALSYRVHLCGVIFSFPIFLSPRLSLSFPASLCPSSPRRLLYLSAFSFLSLQVFFSLSLRLLLSLSVSSSLFLRVFFSLSPHLLLSFSPSSSLSLRVFFSLSPRLLPSFSASSLYFSLFFLSPNIFSGLAVFGRKPLNLAVDSFNLYREWEILFLPPSPPLSPSSYPYFSGPNTVRKTRVKERILLNQ